MAVPILTSTSYGLRIIGGTDVTILSTNKLRVKSLLFFPDANSGTVIITDKYSNAIMTIVGSSTAGVESQICIDGYFDGIGCDFSGTASVLLVFLE